MELYNDVRIFNSKLTYTLLCVKIYNVCLEEKAMKTFNTEKFCHKLISLRSNKTQQAFADEIGINRSTLSLLETGKQLPTLEILNKICDFSKTIIDEFFIENEKDGLIYLMGSMDESDRKKIGTMIEKIHTREKYSVLARRCLDDISK